MKTLDLVGIGNTLAGDDGVGLVLVKNIDRFPHVKKHCHLHFDPMDFLTYLLADSRSVLIVDCADMGLLPGSYRQFRLYPGCSVMTHSKKCLNEISSHGLGLLEIVELAVEMGFSGSLDVFGIQPYCLTSYGLSEPMKKRLPVLREALGDLIQYFEMKCDWSNDGENTSC